jgi:SAM-dependent methyltransferase
MSNYLSDWFSPLFEKKKPEEKWLKSDEQFNQLYPFSMQVLANRHWTPLKVARKASNFLSAENNVRILDIGSGVGKFCLAAAYNNPTVFYYGVEQRKSLVTYAQNAQKKLGLKNVCFIHGNFTQLDFRNYDHFYFFNSFYENLTNRDRIDDRIEGSGKLFNYYNSFLSEQLSLKPSGTKLVSLSSRSDEVPSGYHLADSKMEGALNFWIKQ